MGFNITLIGQMITFMVFVGITMKWIWPPIMKALRERQDNIAEGLASAERGKRELELAKHKSADILRDAKLQAAKTIDQANKRAQQIIEQSKEDARVEGQRLIDLAQVEIAQERETAKESLRQEVASIALAGAEKILGKQIDDAANNHIIEQLLAEVSNGE